MDEAELDRLKELREAYDRSLLICDPITHAWRNQNLLHAIAEHLIRPLQEHEFEEKHRIVFEEEDNSDEDTDWADKAALIRRKELHEKENIDG